MRAKAVMTSRIGRRGGERARDLGEIERAGAAVKKRDAPEHGESADRV